MKVYVETNFVLELAFLQEQYSSCDKILSLCEENRIELILPAYSLAEPFETLHRRQKKRRILQQELNTELMQITRSSSFAGQSENFDRLTALLTQSAEEDVKNFEHVRTRLLNSADIISLDAQVLKDASKYEKDYRLSKQDALVFSSVLTHLVRRKFQPSYFLNRNSKDFDDKNVLEQLGSFKCKLITQFDDGCQLIFDSLN